MQTQTSPRKHEQHTSVSYRYLNKSGLCAKGSGKGSGGASGGGGGGGGADIDEDVCQVCFIVSGTTADARRDSDWVKCTRSGCKYWVHIKCRGYHPKPGEHGEERYQQFVADMQHVLFLCPTHDNGTGAGNLLRPPSLKYFNGLQYFQAATNLHSFAMVGWYSLVG